MNDAPLVIGLDASTTACKTVAYEANGRVVAEGREALTSYQPQPGWYEQPADAWWAAAASALRQAAAQIETARLAALCVSHQRESFVPLDAEYRPLCNGIVWMDERSRDLLPALEAQLGREEYHQLTGRPLTANLTSGKIAWLRQHEPEIFAQTRYYADTHAYLAHQLTGHLRSGWGSADPTGLFDTKQTCWAAPVLNALGLEERQLPELYPPGTIIGEVTAEAAAQTGLPRGLPLVCGLGDGQSAGLGANITAPGPAYLNLGTAVVSGTYSDTYIADRAFRTTCGGVAGSYLLETVLLGGAYTVSWFEERIAPYTGGDTSNGLVVYEAAASELPPGAEGLILVPYWNSVMNPYWDATAGGIIIGWRGHHDRRHLYRAILEGIAYELRLHIEGVETATKHPITESRLMGGGSRSALWPQIIADITGKPVRMGANAEASALGAGILAAAGVGMYPDVRTAAAEMVHVDSTCILPNDARHEIYSRLYEEVYLSLYPALQPALQRLAALT